VLFGGDGNDRIVGGEGNDFQIGGAGDDVYFVDHAGDTAQENEGQGHDAVFASVSHALWAFVEDLTLTGGADIEARGNNHDNAIRGNAGNNALIGGFGVDMLTGGEGADRFVWESAGEAGRGVGNRDVVADFAHGDSIDLRFDANQVRDGVQAFVQDTGGTFRAGEFRVEAAADHLLVRLNLGGGVQEEIEVHGVSELTLADFLL
jgi:Ca2+-binding RTX toxin-like protein